jgi:hypothetical protein
MKNDDWGYFGKGLDGYMHYNQFMTHDRQMLDRPYGKPQRNRPATQKDTTAFRVGKAVILGLSALGYVMFFVSQFSK